ncbi:MAG TPA: peptide chain release factor 1 [Myxococcota bacterium]|nr:peptide chain release factor 1 [Myxococcota bacterium]
MAQPQTDWPQRIREIEARVAALEQRLADPAAAQKPGELAKVGKELSDLRPVLDAGDAYRKVLKAIADNQEMARDADPELSALAQAELPELEAKRDQLVQDIRRLLIPKDPTDERDAILEIRAGTGGEEAALFAADLFRMYSRYAEAKRWKIEPLSMSETGSGGFKEIIVGISGKEVFGRLKYERGVHRVQRVPATESAGRIHTSTVTVAILPEAEEVDITINPADLRIDVFRAGGPGGQSVNTTDSAVRVTHIPTGVVVSCQDEKSQHKNKAKALKVLRSRLLEAELERQANERASDRRAQVGTGDRSEKIRTYNYPQNRVTDHRAGITLHQLDRVMEGGVDELLDGVASFMTSEREKQLAGEGSAA